MQCEAPYPPIDFFLLVVTCAICSTEFGLVYDVFYRFHSRSSCPFNVYAISAQSLISWLLFSSIVLQKHQIASLFRLAIHPMSSPKTLLITGATGKQGGAVIRAVFAYQPSPPFQIIAVTRSIASKSAQALVSKPNVSLVEGDLDNPAAIFQQLGPVWGVFSVQVSSPHSSAEEIQGTALIGAAIAHGVKHIVYTSGDRGGPERSPDDPTPVKSFIAKYNIEKYLEKHAAISPHAMTYTTLRAVTFYENQSLDIHGKGFARMWEQIGAKKLQMISTRDIGWFTANAFLHPEENRNVALSIAGDELTQREAAVIFKEVLGTSMPIAPCLIGSAVKAVHRETLGDMFGWFKDVGYGADVSGLIQKYRNYRTWLRESSGFVKK